MGEEVGGVKKEGSERERGYGCRHEKWQFDGQSCARQVQKAQKVARLREKGKASGSSCG